MKSVALSLSRTFDQHITQHAAWRAVSSPLVHAITRARGLPLFAESSAGTISCEHNCSQGHTSHS